MAGGVGPESSRRGAEPASTPLAPSEPASERSAILATIAAELCPQGPRPAAEIAMALGCMMEEADLPAAAPVFISPDGRTILYRADERAERSILEGAAAVALRTHGVPVNPRSVSDLARQLSRPAAVRSAAV